MSVGTVKIMNNSARVEGCRAVQVGNVLDDDLARLVAERSGVDLVADPEVIFGTGAIPRPEYRQAIRRECELPHTSSPTIDLA
jgi:hypothetical protein